MSAGSSDSEIVGNDAAKLPTAVAGLAGSKRRAMVKEDGRISPHWHLQSLLVSSRRVFLAKVST